MVTAPVIALLTDFGTSDGYVGVMKGVMAGIAPGVATIDITHEIAPQDVRGAAWVLAMAWRYFPLETVFLAVVDPGVGSARRAVAVHAGGRNVVTPDNGLLSFVLREAQPDWAVELSNAKYHLPDPSATFHGRDIFAPMAAHLAAGIAPRELGEPLDPATLCRLELPEPRWQGNVLLAEVLHIDHFGNLITNLDRSWADSVLEALSSSIQVDAQMIAERAATFALGPAGRPFMLRDSSGHVAIAVRNGSARDALQARIGTALEVHGLRPPPQKSRHPT